MNRGGDRVYRLQLEIDQFQSEDGGLTWANTTAVGAFSGQFAAPVFVSCGQANAPCANFSFLYVFFPGALDGGAYWDNNDAMFLARVSPENVDNAAAYEFFVGFDSENTPQWSLDSSQAQPSLYFGRMIGENAVFFNPFLGPEGRFVMANFGLIDNSGSPRPWHTKPYMSPHRTQACLRVAVAIGGLFQCVDISNVSVI